MRNPNGYGSVIKLSGNRRRPFMARVTTGYKDNGQPIYKALDYFTRREDALICLANYNEAQFDIDYRNLTFSELFDKLKEIEYPRLSSSLQYTLSAAYGHCGKLYKARYRTIKKYQMQSCIDNCGKSYATQTNIKNLFYHMDRLAFELDIISKRYSETLTVKASDPKKKVPFTDAEVETVWKNAPDTDMILFLLYTGCRLSEMLLMRCVDIDLKAGYMTGGIKTEAGKNRIIPIHANLRPVIERNMNGGEYLFQIPQGRSEDVLRARKRYFQKVWDRNIGESHTSHDCRHTVRSRLDSAGANKVAIDLIMGHKSSDVGERVYTHKTVKELQEALAMLSYGSSVSNA